MAKVDRRVEKTKNNIKSAYFELLKTKPADKITVQEICDLANCSRNTFYMHYLYKENLYESTLNECVDSVLDSFKPHGKIRSQKDLYLVDEYVSQFLNGIEKNEDTLKVIIHSDTRYQFSRKLSEAIFETLQQSTKTAGYNNAESFQYKLMCRYTAFGFVEFSFYWLEHKELELSELKSVLHDIIESAMINGYKYGHKV